MGFAVIIFLILAFAIYVVFFLQMRAWEADLHLFLHTLRFLITIFISFVAFVLYLMYAYRVEPGNINLFTIKDTLAMIDVLSMIFGTLAIYLIRRKVFPKFQQKYGLKSRGELAKLSFYNKKKMIKKWENENADLEYYKP